jgi:putative ABC transport system substrate-binding protein
MMRRREFIAGLGSAAAWPVVAQAQRQVLPVVGVLWTGSPPNQFVDAFHKGLADMGYADGRNVTILSSPRLLEYDRLREFAAGLVQRGVAVIAAPGSTPAALAAKEATATIPVVFSIGGDPVQLGLVASLNRPGGNVTGFSSMNTEVGPKRVGLMHELLPHAARFGVLVNPKNALAEFAVKDAQVAVGGVGQLVEISKASTDDEIDAAFASLTQKRVDALLVASPDSFLYTRRAQVVALAQRHAIPAAYYDRAFPQAGGLMSYGSRVADNFRQAGIYAGRILKGEKPADLPVMQPTQFELVINLKTAKALDLTVPSGVLAIADEVIE